MKRKVFKSGDLKLNDLQYLIKHKNTNCFEIGDEVFLKSNPKNKMIVHSIDNDEVGVLFILNSEYQYFKFPPECLLQYKYSSLLVYKNKIDICLN